MARPNATATGSMQSASNVAEPSNKNKTTRKKSNNTPSSEVLGLKDIIVLDSDDDFEPSTSNFNSTRDFASPRDTGKENKENNSSDFQEGNVSKSVGRGKKRKNHPETLSEAETSAKGSQSPSDLPDSGHASSEVRLTTCHQCRQRFSTSIAWCQNTSSKRACTQKYCEKCLRNRYGEKVADVERLETWSCPRCRGICNCSFCMKKKGLAPTGGLAKKAKAAGYSSVADLLESFPNMREERFSRDESVPGKSEAILHQIAQLTAVEEVVHETVPSTSVRKKKVKKEVEVTTGPPIEHQTRSSDEKYPAPVIKETRLENPAIATTAIRQQLQHDGGGQDAVLHEEDVDEEISISKMKRRSIAKTKPVEEMKPVEDVSKASSADVLDVVTEDVPEEEIIEEDIVLPIGVQMLQVGNLDLPPEAVGPALQVLEFCTAFAKPLELGKKKPSKILSEMVRGGTLRRAGGSEVVQLHVVLLSIILDDMDDDSPIAFSATAKNCWVFCLEKHLSEKFSLNNAGEVNSRQEEGVPASTSGTKSKAYPLWPFSNEEMAVVTKALKGGVESYGNQSITTRLQILAILCDDTLDTKKMRDYIDLSATKHDNDQKKTREELLAIKKRAKEVHEHDKEEVLAAKRENITPIVSPEQITRVKQEYAELAATEADLTKEFARLNAPRCDALRTEPAAIHKNGTRFWRLNGANDREAIVLQDISKFQDDTPYEAWSIFPEDLETVVQQCVTDLVVRSKLRRRRSRRKKTAPLILENTDPKGKEPESPEISIIELSD